MSQAIVLSQQVRHELRRIGMGDTTTTTLPNTLAGTIPALQTEFASAQPTCNSDSNVKAFQVAWNTAYSGGAIGSANTSGSALLRTDGLYDASTQQALTWCYTNSSPAIADAAPAPATCSSAAQALASMEGALGGGTTGMVVLGVLGAAAVGGVGYLIFRAAKNPLPKRRRRSSRRR
jgi:hypothetical protein